MTTALEPILSPILVGRDEQLQLAEDRLTDAAAGRGRTLLVAGEAGIGKTRFVRSIARRAQALGFDSVPGRPRAPGYDDPRGAPARHDPDDAFDPRRVDLANALLEEFAGATRDGGMYRRAFIVDMVDRIRAAIDRPTLIVFEDLQWADDLSLEGIGELSRHADGMPVLIVARLRLDETPPGTPFARLACPARHPTPGRPRYVWIG